MPKYPRCHRLPLLAALAVALSATSAFAQPSVSFDLGHQFDTISGYSTLDDTARELGVSFDVEHLFAAERARIFYGADAADYAVEGDWRTLVHQLGATYRFDLGTSQKTSLFVGGDATFRRNGDAWAAADYNAVGAFANLELKPAPTTTFRTGYRFDVRRFDDFSALDQDEHTGFASLLVNLQTRTTLIAEASVGRRAYNAVPATTTWVSETEPATAPTATQNGAGMGRGAGGAGIGRFATATHMVLEPGSPAARANRVTIFGRVAQSLTNRVAISFDVSRRFTGGDIPPAVVETPARFFDDGIYDDAYASEVLLGRIALKAMLNRGLQVDLGGFGEDKDYTATVARDETGAPLADGTRRNDTVYQAFAALRVPLAPNHTGSWDVAVVTRYDFTRHRSTDAFYRYTSHAVGVGLSLSY